jgi:hypothetical protein
MQRESIPYVTYTKSIASFLADFYALSTSASLEYIEYAGMLLLLLNSLSSDADAGITRKNPPKMKQYL